MGDLSRNFRTSEFRCHHCGVELRPTDALVQVLQRARNHVGRPLIIVSGFRCPAGNAKVGGIRKSRHLLADAADVIGGYATAAQWESFGAKGIGIRDGRVIHVDCTPGKPFRFVD
jgi:uncharacterized protein YcbK (DUF882 family)